MSDVESGTDDVVVRLRRGGGCADVCRTQNAASGCECAEAADEIERLRFEAASWKGQMEGCEIQWRRASAEAKAFFAQILELEEQLKLAKMPAGEMH
ncbi:MAG: hypothetical protein ACRYG8_43965 [Janthinobacterium lividum]